MKRLDRQLKYGARKSRPAPAPRFARWIEGIELAAQLPPGLPGGR